MSLPPPPWQALQGGQGISVHGGGPGAACPGFRAWQMAWCRAALPLLLIAASSVRGGEAFKCFTCEQPTTISLCKNVTRCKPEATACQTVLVQVESEYPFNQSPKVTRSCANSCIATDPDSIGIAHPVYCCFYDLCNSMQGTRLGASRRGPRSSAASFPEGPSATGDRLYPRASLSSPSLR
ncbi:secreted Ly-6/uPAR-related protein 1 [Mustela putorius furo]|uniref:Secreted Ly-6/uPAR-related protein 1 n=1 Tax=Mustela putorius furo TaxID=9669 RepID=A0A8U0S0I6_MUSPF|nr:secreted Ly-6/uPAR-related protein 1 [Mustela putorius furo]